MDEVIEQPIEAVQEEVQVQNEIQEEVKQDDVQEEVKEESKPEPKDEPIPKGVQKRIDRAVRDKYEAQARTKMLEERLSQIEQEFRQPKQVQQVPDAPPRLEDFDTIEAHSMAVAEYVAERKFNEKSQEFNVRQQQDRTRQYQEQIAEKFTRNLEKATAELPDYEDVMATSGTDIPMPEYIRVSIMDSDVGPHIAYYLAMHPEEARKIVNQNPQTAVRLLGRIEEKIESGVLKKAQKSNAPEPVKPVGQSAKVTKSPADMTDTEFAAWRKSYIKNRHN